LTILVLGCGIWASENGELKPIEQVAVVIGKRRRRDQTTIKPTTATANDALHKYYLGGHALVSSAAPRSETKLEFINLTFNRIVSIRSEEVFPIHKLK
jgi:hypothetical protein